MEENSNEGVLVAEQELPAEVALDTVTFEEIDDSYLSQSASLVQIS